MSHLYKLFAVSYIFIILTSYAVDDLFGVDRSFISSAFVFIGLYIQDIFIDHYLFRMARKYHFRLSDRLKLSVFAGCFWVVAEGVFAALDMLFYGWGGAREFLWMVTQPLFFLTGGIIGVAVWFSLGYGLTRK